MPKRPSKHLSLSLHKGTTDLSTISPGEHDGLLTRFRLLFGSNRITISDGNVTIVLIQRQQETSSIKAIDSSLIVKTNHVSHKLRMESFSTRLVE